MRMNLTMYFKYGNHKRSEVTANSTFDAVKRKERFSTIRKEYNGKYYNRNFEDLKKLKKGDWLYLWSEKGLHKGEYIIVELTYDPVYIAKGTILNDQRMERLSKLEGWSVEYLKKRGYHKPDFNYVQLTYKFLL